MINDESVDNALRYLAESAEEAAQARADKVYLTEFRKTKKAELMNKSDAETESGRERHAYAHKDYKGVLEGYKEAVRQDALHSFKRTAAEAVIEAWRTQQANIRAAESIR
jgi:hypothetical protein